MNEKYMEFQTSNEPVIIYGAGPIGEITFRALQKRKINVMCFCDHNLNKTKEKFLGLDVIPFYTLTENDYKNHPVLVTPMREFQEAVDKLYENGVKRLYSVKDCIMELDLEGEAWINYEKDYLEYCREIYINEISMDRDEIVLRYVDLPLTQKCTMRCDGCANLMQYFQHPADYPLEAILSYIDALEVCVDKIINLVLLGGEPFMYKNIIPVLERLKSVDKIKKVLVFTNGTIVPGEDVLKAMKECNVLVQISDYGAQSRNIDKLIAVLKERRILYSVARYHVWNDFGGLHFRGRDTEGMKELYNHCRGRYTMSIADGKLFRCVRSSHRYLLDVRDKDQIEFVDLLDEDTALVRSRLKQFIYNMDMCISCNYCDGFIEGGKLIEVARQLDKPLPVE